LESTEDPKLEPVEVPRQTAENPCATGAIRRWDVRFQGSWNFGRPNDALYEKFSVAGWLAAWTFAIDPVPNYLRASAPEEMRAGR